MEDGIVTFNAEQAGVYAVVEVETGDANLDLKLNINDTLSLLKAVSAGEARTALNDVDGNDSFNINDILAVLKKITQV